MSPPNASRGYQQLVAPDGAGESRCNDSSLNRTDGNQRVILDGNLSVKIAEVDYDGWGLTKDDFSDCVESSNSAENRSAESRLDRPVQSGNPIVGHPNCLARML